MSKPTKVIDLNELQRLFLQAWGKVLHGKPRLEPTFDKTFPGFYCREENVGIAASGEHYVIGHIDLKGNFIPNAGPFDSAAGAVICAIGVIANGQASLALQSSG